MLNHCKNILNSVNPSRQLALDVFRGLTILAMILVNNPGSWQYVYAPLQHAQWHGWTPTDLIFPFFIFIVGIAIAINLAKFQQQPFSAMLQSTAARSMKLILIGWFLALFWYDFYNPGFSWWQDRFEQLRVFGVLQRIGIVFFVTVLLVRYFANRSLLPVAAFLLVSYGLLLQYWPYPLRDPAQLLQPGNNFVGYLDTLLLGSAHLYQSKLLPYAFDPEGALSTIPAIATCLLGVWAGQQLTRSLAQQLQIFIVAAIVLTGLGLGLDLWQPINKSLWTPAFVLLSAGLALACYALLIYLLDLRRLRLWSAPFVVFGANAMLFFVFAGVFARVLLMVKPNGKALNQEVYLWLAQWLDPYLASFCYSLIFLSISYALMWYCYQKRWFWKV